MRVVHVASEVAPWVQTGGLGQVVGALPDALAELGVDVTVLAPLHRGVRERVLAAGGALVATNVSVSVVLGGQRVTGRFVAAPSRQARSFFLDCPLLFDRAEPYGIAGVDYPDNPFRFAFLARAAILAADRLAGGPVDVVHAHDWQAGLIPAYLAQDGGPRPATVFTIHNLAFQGLCDRHLVPQLGLDWAGYRLDGFEFWGQLSLLKAGAAFADQTTTVSPTYAREIATAEFGCGLDGFFRHRPALGILNGIDPASWDPARDPAIAAAYAADRPAGKALCRQALGDEFGLAAGGTLFGMVSRLTEQKGVDLVLELAVQLPELGGRLVVLGSGDPDLEVQLTALAAAMPEHVAFRAGFDEALARRIFAGADAVLMPSRFEPCGLAQLQAMRYGALPIVNPVGGLGDTVDDPGDEGLRDGRGTGLRLDRPDLRGLIRAVARAVALHRDPAAWSRVVRNAMARDGSWRGPAASYLELYRRLVAP